MPFTKRGKLKFTRRKGDSRLPVVKNSVNTNIAEADENIVECQLPVGKEFQPCLSELPHESNLSSQIPSDEFFSNCLEYLLCPSEYSSISKGCHDSYSESECNMEVADEYYVVIHNTPFQYYEHDDLDTFVKSKSARIFSQFKENCGSIENDQFTCLKQSTSVNFVQMYEDSLIKVKLAVTVNADFGVSIQVHDKRIPSTHDIWDSIPRICHSQTTLVRILEKVSQYRICSGNDDSRLQHLIPEGSFLDAADKSPRQGYRTCYSGISTIISSQCNLLVLQGRCKCCTKYRGTLRSILHRETSTPKIDTPKKDWLKSRLPFNKLTNNQKFYKFKQHQEYTKSLEDENTKLKRLLMQEIDRKGVILNDDDNDDFMEIMQNSIEKESTNYRENENSYKMLFWEQQLKYNQLRDKRQMRWHPMIIKWCILLRSKSSSGYDALCKSGFVSLPSERLLYDYTHLAENATGYQPEVVKMLYQEVYGDAEPESLPKWKKIVGILHDEIKIQSDLVYDKITGKLVGFIDLNKVGNDLANIDEIARNEEKQLAKQVLVIMVRGVASSLKFPLAYFATTGVNSDQLFSILWQAVEILEIDLGLVTLFITSDGASPNRRFCRLHRGNQEGIVYRAVNDYSSDRRYIYFISDPPHLMKTARNCFASSYAHKKTRKLWNNDKDISWLHIVDLFKDHCTGNLRPCPKLSREHIDLTSYNCMKVNVAVQVLSKTVADALEMLYGDKTTETVKFIRHMNKFFDCLNVRHLNEGFKKRNNNMHPFTSIEDERLDYLLNEFLKYFDDWKMSIENRNGSFSKSERSAMQLSYQTLEGIEMTVKSVVECVKFCLESGADFVLTNKFNQDPIEQHFGVHRSSCGSNTNPTVHSFANTMVRLRTIGSQALAPLKGNTKRKLSLTPIDDTPLQKRKRRSSN